MWNRKKIIEFCNSQIFPKVNTWTGFHGELMDVVSMVSKFRRENNFPENMEALVSDGFLYINRKSVGRIAPKAPRSFDNERACYWEGKILAMQER